MNALFFLLILAACNSFSANINFVKSSGVSIIGNGGDVVTCTQANGIIKAELLDIYEAKTLLGLSPSLGSVNDSAVAQAAELIARADAVSPKMRILLTEWVHTFFQETLFLTGVDLADIPDSDHIVLPKNCKIQQIVNQRTPNTSTEKRYILSKDLWDLLDQNNKTALILHEVIYRYFLQIGHKNSVGARLFNAYILSNVFSQLNIVERLNLLTQIKFPVVSVNGLYVKLFQVADFGEASDWKLLPIEFYSNESLKKATVADNEKILMFESNLELSGEIEFYPSGKINVLTLSKDIWIIYEKQKVLLKSGRLELYENGKIKKANFGSELSIVSLCFLGKIKGETFLSEASCPLIALSATGEVLIQNKWYKIKYGETLTFYSDNFPRSVHLSDFVKTDSLQLIGKIVFYQNGRIESAWLFEDQTVVVLGKNVRLSKFGPIGFYDNGVLKSACVSSATEFVNSNGEVVKLPSRNFFVQSQDSVKISRAFVNPC